MIRPPGDPLVIDWETEDAPTNPLDCHLGNITVTSNDGPTRDIIQFNYCNTNSPNNQKVSVQDFDPDSTYTIVVCSMNPIGQNCSDPVIVYTPISPSLEPLAPMLGEIIGGVLAGVLIIGLIAIIIVLLVLVYLKGSWWRNYNPEKRGDF